LLATAGISSGDKLRAAGDIDLVDALDRDQSNALLIGPVR